MNRKEYSELLLPNVKHDVLYYEQQYPKRALPEGAMVTRFGPSPTGFVHMGSLYSSFADLVFAHQTKGIAYLRIEDTDQKREIKDGVAGIINDFDRLGIIWDEGPTQGGNYGPYIQSARKDIYQAYARLLIEKDLAYPCFCNEEFLDNQRVLQEQKKARLGYYGKYAKCRNLTEEEVIAKVKAGEKYAIRMKSPGSFENKVILDDLIKGQIIMNENDLDHVIIKSGDGLPTYHFAHAVDDHLMKTTHVIRDDSWVSSYPIHQQLFKMLGFIEPQYAHIAPITIKEGNSVRKLSKRKDPTAAISYYAQLGIPNEVIKLYLASVNNSNFEEWYTNNPDKTIEDFTFAFNKMPIGGSLFDIDKLMSIAKIYFSSQKSGVIYEKLLTYTKEYDPDFYQIIKIQKAKTIANLDIERYVPRPRRDMGSYSDYKKYSWYMYDELIGNSDYEKITKKEFYDDQILNEYITSYYNEADTKEEWFNKIKELAGKNNFAKEVKEYKQNPEAYQGHVGDVCELIRVAVTTQTMTPDLYEILKVLGKKSIQKRINLFSELFK